MSQTSIGVQLKVSDKSWKERMFETWLKHFALWG